MVQVLDFPYYSDFWFMQYMLILAGESTVDIGDLFIQLTGIFLDLMLWGYVLRGIAQL